MNRHSQRHSGGFTLVETLAAGIIFALSAAVVGVSVRQGMRSLESARDYQLASELLDETLTKIEITGPSRMYVEGPTSGVCPPPNDRFRWAATIDARPEGRLYDVIVRISWQTSNGGQRSVDAETFMLESSDVTGSELVWDDL